jgi:hypothetical protein
MYARASKTSAVRSSLAVLLRIAVLFALTVLFLLPHAKGVTIPCHQPDPSAQT